MKFFHASRDRWRQRAKTYQREIRSLEVRVRDVEASRDHWRARYYQGREAGGATEASESDSSPELPQPDSVREGIGGAGWSCV
jgi:hypothetical protein